MVATTVIRSGPVTVIDYRCAAGPAAEPYVENHSANSISYVRKGSFGYRTRGVNYDMVAGSVLVGSPGDEYLCTHDHHLGGDQCLSIQFSAEWMEANEAPLQRWSSRAIPPLPELMVLGELAQRSAAGGNDLALEEAAMLLAARFLELDPSITQSPTQRGGNLQRGRLAKDRGHLNLHSEFLNLPRQGIAAPPEQPRGVMAPPLCLCQRHQNHRAFKLRQGRVQNRHGRYGSVLFRPPA